MSSLSNRRGADQSPSSLHRSHSSHRSEMPRSFDGYVNAAGFVHAHYLVSDVSL